MPILQTTPAGFEKWGKKHPYTFATPFGTLTGHLRKIDSVVPQPGHRQTVHQLPTEAAAAAILYKWLHISFPVRLLQKRGASRGGKSSNRWRP